MTWQLGKCKQSGRTLRKLGLGNGEKVIIICYTKEFRFYPAGSEEDFFFLTTKVIHNYKQEFGKFRRI